MRYRERGRELMHIKNSEIPFTTEIAHREIKKRANDDWKKGCEKAMKTGRKKKKSQ